MNRIQLTNQFVDELFQTNEPSSQFETVSRIVNMIMRHIKQYGCDKGDELAEIAGDLYDQFVRPGPIPDFIDDRLKLMLMEVIEAAVIRWCDTDVEEDSTDDTEDKDGPSIKGV